MSIFYGGGGRIFRLEVASFDLGQLKESVYIHGKPFIKTNKESCAAAF